MENNNKTNTEHSFIQAKLLAKQIIINTLTTQTHMGVLTPAAVLGVVSRPHAGPPPASTPVLCVLHQSLCAPLSCRNRFLYTPRERKSDTTEAEIAIRCCYLKLAITWQVQEARRLRTRLFTRKVLQRKRLLAPARPSSDPVSSAHN